MTELLRPAIPGALGRYELVGLIASGAMGRIHLARQLDAAGRDLGEVAIKRVRRELADDPTILQMFEDEARISAQLSHPNVVRALEVGWHEGQPFMAMERVAGVTLQDLARRLHEMSGVLPVPSVLEILIQVLDALDHAHRLTDASGEPLGIVHRDVSPQNVMLSFAGEVKIFDFGVGKARGKTHQTNPGFVKGKLAYMSPEQIRNQAVDERSDLFSVGVLAYEALVLVHPFYGKTDAAMMRAIVEHAPPAPRSVEPELPEELEAILLRALEKDPACRFESARDMREALERFASGRVFPPSPSVAALLQDAFQSRIRLEARARRRGDDAQLVRVLRGELDENDVADDDGPDAGAEQIKQRGEELFADLPTADLDVSGLDVLPSSGAAPAAEAESPQARAAAPRETSPSPPRASRPLDELRLLVEATPTPLFVSRVHDGHILYANEPLAELFGLGPSGAVGVPASSLYVNPADRARVVVKATAEGTVRNHVVELLRRNGSRFWGSLSVRLLEHRGERVFIGSIGDVSDRVAVESRLARRLGHERRLAQAVAALLRTRDADPGSAGLEEALGHLRAATEADRVVLVQNELAADGVLTMHRSHVIGVEPPSLPGRGRVPYDRVPRWRSLLERGDSIRARAGALPEGEDRLLETLGVTGMLAVPVERRGRWLGFLALEATRGRHDWTDEDVAALETLAGIVAGELERRRARAEARVGGDTAHLVSLGARVGAALPRWAAEARQLAERTGDPEALALAASLEANAFGAPAPDDGPTRLSVADRLAATRGVELEVAGDAPPAWVPGPLLERFMRCVIEEVASVHPVRARLARSASGDLELAIRWPADARTVWDALDGDPVALAQPGARVGSVVDLVERMGGDVRFDRGQAERGLRIELPAADLIAAPLEHTS